jgi:NAD(P)-dependent dehydrogenase (short-subunit alcohol dehydrogenase family)
MVTGAAGGIGRATVGRLASGGHVVFAADRKESALHDLAEELPRMHPVDLDVTELSSIDRAFDKVQAETDGYGLDVLVNVAGIMILGPVEAVPDDLVQRQFKVNVFGLLAVTRAFLPQMRERRAGRIVNVSSVLGRFALPGSGLYSASKFAVEAASDALRIELAPFGVRVVLVEPGVIDTPLYDKAAASLPSYDQALEPYRATWPAGFGFPEPLLKAAVPAEKAGAVLARAALDSSPRDRYRPGARSRFNTRLLTALPMRTTDRIKARITHMANTPRRP